MIKQLEIGGRHVPRSWRRLEWLLSLADTALNHWSVTSRRFVTR